MTDSNHHGLTLSYGTASGTILDDPYWLTFEQQGTDDGATVADVAEVVDALYDTNLCVDTSVQGVDEVSTANADPQTEDEVSAMRDKLLGVSKETMDINACKIDSSGDYQTVIVVRCSHPDIPYTLRLSTTGGILAALGDPDAVRGLPEVLQTVRQTAVITVVLDVKNAASIVLPSPVIKLTSVVMGSGYTPVPSPGDLSASWMGTPIPSGNDPVDTTIRVLHNTLYWDGNVTGTIVASYQTVYDLVTVSVPGIILSGSENGKTQNATILAFYHGQAYPGSINAPTADASVDDPTRDAICNPTKVTGVTLTPPDDKNYPDKSKYGCEVEDSGLNDRELYKRLCCKYPSGALKTCSESTAPLPAKQISQADKDNFLAGGQFGVTKGNVTFVAIPPCGTEGCGKKITRVSLVQHVCCAERPPLVWDAANSVGVLAPGQSGFVFATGGYPPFYWKVRGYGFAIGDDYHRECYTDVPYVRVYALSMACGPAPITVSDQCTEAMGGIRSSVGGWRRLGTINPDSFMPGITGAVSCDIYLPERNGGDLSRYSPDNQYWFGPDSVPPGTIGTSLMYVNSLSGACWGMLGSNQCLDGYSILDPYVKAFNIILFKGCSYAEGPCGINATYSAKLYRVNSIYQWVC